MTWSSLSFSEATKVPTGRKTPKKVAGANAVRTNCQLRTPEFPALLAIVTKLCVHRDTVPTERSERLVTFLSETLG